jgi:quercetin dioxygenase-like cupin family protein
MKKALYVLIVFSAAFYTKAIAQNSLFPKGEIGTNTDNYTGTIWLNHLSEANSTFGFSIAQATFAPGSKLDWHIHPGGQVLLITEGTGYYQEKGKPVEIVHKGEVIKCVPGVEHWHAAAPNSSFAYVAISPTQKGKTIWLQDVTDKEYQSINLPAASSTNEEAEIKNLSKKKWDWMADKNVDSLDALFDEKSVFVHMGGSWGKKQEINVIKSGGIWYKKAAIYSVTVNLFGNTAILLNDIDLVAVVGGKEVTNPFMVTEVYIKENGKWKMGSLTFSHLLRPVKMNNNNK